MVYYCIIRFLYTKKVFKHVGKYRSENNFIGLSVRTKFMYLIIILIIFRFI